MKKNIKIYLVAILLFVGLSHSEFIYSQVPDPPSGHGSSSNESPGGGAPIGGGLFILVSLGIAYGGKKMYDIRKEELEG
ncbi:MAG: hypothetical protein HQ521_09810 [Bacteroidetes bacterium]|nr:hypothetical protein [Bacteroidota bacterium]